MAVTLFISYAHKDEALLDALLDHLRPLAAQGVIDLWHDRRMIAGDDIFPNIEAALDRAQIVLLLVSEAFVGSDECAREMWRALKARDRGRTVVVPVILQECRWRAAPFGALNALPTDGAPIMRASDRAAACREVADGVRRLAGQMLRRNGASRRRRIAALAGFAALFAIVAVTLRGGRLPWFGASAQPTDIASAAGVVVIVELAVVAPNGKPWNPDAQGVWRLPDFALCFRHDEAPGIEICRPTALGGRASSFGNRTHVAAPLPDLVAWSETFHVEIADRREHAVRRIGRGHCRFGSACRLVADDATPVGELLVLPWPDSTDPILRSYLDRCIDPQSRLARQWLAFSAAAGASAGPGRMSHVALAEAFVAVADIELTPSMVDALVARTPPAFANLPPQDALRADVFQAAASSLEHGDASPLDRDEVRSALAALRSAVGAAVPGEGCR